MVWSRVPRMESRAGDPLVRGTGALTVGVSVAVFTSLLVRHVDLNPFNVAVVLLGLASGAVALRTARAFPALLLLVLAAGPTIFGWYVFFYLPLLLLLATGGLVHVVGWARSRAAGSKVRSGLNP